MKRLFTWILAMSMLLAFVGCAAEKKNAGEAAGVPGTENTATIPEGNNNTTTTDENDNTVPEKDDNAMTDEGSDAPSDEPEPAPNRTLTSDELKEWENYFNTLENNGLLRFPYSDLDTDPDQLAPYLHWMFYDIGAHESEFSDEERSLLAETDLWLELDAFRLSREFMNGYLFNHLNIPADKTENLLDAAKLGVYLLEYDAWYIAHGDTAYNPYTMDRGVVLEDGTIKLSYVNNFLGIVQDNGELDYIDAEMIITIMPREDGSFYIAAHEINSNPYQD